jgi:cytochrome bd-type quinol oxidase subunit 1
MADQAALYNLLYNRLQFALTVSFHYLFPQLTM